jgi:two-component system sensor histidine kinase PilS (NtrC family)
VKADDDGLLRAVGWGRLGLAGVLLLLFPRLPGDLVPRNAPLLLTTALVIAVLSSGVLLLRRSRAPRRMAWVISLLDIVIATGVVAATGGVRSIFTFLYVLSVIAACVLLSRMGGLVMAASATLLYAGLVLGDIVFPMAVFLEAPNEASALELLTIFLNAATFLVVAVVAGGLAERFQRTRRELEARRKDLSDLQAFRDLIFESVGAGLVAVDLRRVITAFNQAAADITGWRAVDAIGQPWENVFGTARPLSVVEDALAADPRAPSRYETTVRRPDGGLVPLRTTFSALRSGDGTRRGLIAVCEDLSIIRGIEARMRQADRLAMLGRMSANIAHEIRNPLASLTGAIEALAAEGTGRDARTRLSAIVLKESDRLNEILRDFLAYARPAPLAIRRIDVAEVMDEVLCLLEHRTELSRIKITREFTPGLAWDVDPQQLRQALWNLSLNALQAVSDTGELRMRAAVEDGRLIIQVTDTGEGILPDDLLHIFEPFYSTKAGGSGLGLALVHRVVQDHGGDLDVRSASGFGTTFTLSLPARHA